jgi:hypothetical protein
MFPLEHEATHVDSEKEPRKVATMVLSVRFGVVENILVQLIQLEKLLLIS